MRACNGNRGFIAVRNYHTDLWWNYEKVKRVPALPRCSGGLELLPRCSLQSCMFPPFPQHCDMLQVSSCNGSQESTCCPTTAGGGGSRSRAPDVPAARSSAPVARSSAQAHELQGHPREQQQRPGTQGLRCASRCSCVGCHHVPRIAAFLVSPRSRCRCAVFRARRPSAELPALSAGTGAVRGPWC